MPDEVEGEVQVGVAEDEDGAGTLVGEEGVGEVVDVVFHCCAFRVLVLVGDEGGNDDDMVNGGERGGVW